MKEMVSFVIPCYRSSQTLPGVVEEIRGAMEKLTEYEYEVVLVNDCSPDDTFLVIRELCGKYENITGINLARNFGQHAALMAGFRYAKGSIVICLDDDGQTPANEAGKLLDEIRKGADVVYAAYEQKQHSWFRNLGSGINELMTRIMLGKPKNLYISSYFAARRFVIDEILGYEGAYPYVIGLILRTTGNIVNVNVTHRQREIGTSGYTMKKLFSLWFNGFTAFSVKPLRMATAVGSICAVGGFAYGIYTIIKKIFIQPPELVTGFSALMSMLVFIGGVTMLMMGLVGEYIGRMYISMNRSPQYVVRELVESKEEKSSEGNGNEKQGSPMGE